MSKRPLSIGSLVVVAVTSLFAHSLATVAGLPATPLVVGAAIIAAVALVLARGFRPYQRHVEQSYSTRVFIGMKIALVGFLVALVGWFIGVYFSVPMGYVVVAIGVALGFVGIGVHAVVLLSGKSGA